MQSLIRLKPAGNAVYNYIQKKRNEGKCGKEAMIAGLNKFLHIYMAKSWNFTQRHISVIFLIIFRRLKFSLLTSALLFTFLNKNIFHFWAFCLSIFLSRFPPAIAVQGS